MASGGFRVGTWPDAEKSPAWPRIEALLAPAAARGECLVWEPGEVVWVTFDGGAIAAAATTRILGDGRAELMNVGGRLAACLALEAPICAWARDCGAGEIISKGRKGWQRPGSRLGWAPAGNGIYRKVLRHGR